MEWVELVRNAINFLEERMIERENLKRSDEEADTLARNTKKFKDSHQIDEENEGNHHAKAGSYRDKLVGAIPGAFEKAFGFASAPRRCRV